MFWVHSAKYCYDVQYETMYSVHLTCWLGLVDKSVLGSLMLKYPAAAGKWQ